MNRVRQYQCPNISRDEESTEYIRQVKQADGHALSKRNVSASWEVYLARARTLTEYSSLGTGSSDY